MLATHRISDIALGRAQEGEGGRESRTSRPGSLGGLGGASDLIQNAGSLSRGTQASHGWPPGLAAIERMGTSWGWWPSRAPRLLPTRSSRDSQNFGLVRRSSAASLPHGHAAEPKLVSRLWNVWPWVLLGRAQGREARKDRSGWGCGLCGRRATQGLDRARLAWAPASRLLGEAAASRA